MTDETIYQSMSLGERVDWLAKRVWVLERQSQRQLDASPTHDGRCIISANEYDRLVRIKEAAQLVWEGFNGECEWISYRGDQGRKAIVALREALKP